jgi:putative hydroxymethylpyrimidine transport system substrate-binding protein
LKKVPFILGAMLVLLLSIITGCTPDKEKKDQLTIMLDWYPNAVHSFIYTALEKGYFAEEGIDLKIQMPAETNDPIRMAAAGQVDIALTYQPQVALARGEGIPVKSMAAIVRHPLNTLLVPADSPIQSPKDLVGKKVGFPSIPLNQAFMETMVTKDGGDPTKVTMQDIGFDIIPALAGKRVDAVYGGFTNHEEILLNKQGFKVRNISFTAYGVPDYYELVFVAGEDTLNEKKDLLSRFWNAALKGQEDVNNNPQDSLEILLANQSGEFPLEKDVEEQSLAVLLPLMMDKDIPFGTQTEESWNRVINWLKEKKQLTNDVQGKDCFVSLTE